MTGGGRGPPFHPLFHRERVQGPSEDAVLQCLAGTLYQDKKLPSIAALLRVHHRFWGDIYLQVTFPF